MSAVETRLERIADGFSFPTSLTFDDEGTAYLAEAGLPFGGVPPGGRVWMLGADGGRELIADDLRPPVNGLTWHEGSLYISEGGHPARISRLARDDELTTILDGLPGPGNYHTNMTVFGPDGKLYFSQGAMTNSAIVGLDAYELGWLRRLPHAHDLPGYDIVLAGVNCETADPLHGDDARTETGAFAPFGERAEAGTTVAGQLPCTAAVMRCNPDGSELELVAWGLRNAYGLGFLEDGRLLAIDQGADDRGSRPIGAAPDVMFEVRVGAWYGWPDFVGGDPVTHPRYRPERGPEPRFLIANHDELPPPEQPLVRFPPHSAAVRFAVSMKGDLVVALFGDEAPMTVQTGVRQGRGVVRVDVDEWTIRPLELDGLLRPIDLRFDQEGALWVLDFGRFEMTTTGVTAEPKTGALYRVREGWL